MKLARIALFCGAIAVACGSRTGIPAPQDTLGCATGGTPNESFADAFDVDTGLSPGVGADYGQAACPDRYLIEVDLTQAPFHGRNLFVSGGWTTALGAQQPCDQRHAVMTAFGLNGTSWSVFDEVAFVGQMQGNVCRAFVQSHTNPSQAGVSGVQLKPATQFQHLRVAVYATVGGAKVPVFAFALLQ